MPVNNNMFQKNSNISLVAREIWKHKEVSRIEIARDLSLYRSTVTNIVSFLLASGVVKEGYSKESSSQGGRKAISLALNSEFGCVLGFDIQPSHYRSVIISFMGEVIWSKVGNLKDLALGDMIFRIVEEAVKAAKEEVKLPILSLNFSVPGEIDSKEGKINYSLPFNISNFNLKKFVQSRYEYPVFVDNDANCASWLDLSVYPEYGNVLSLFADYHEDASVFNDRIGIGLGVGITINGRVYTGSHDRAGEFCSYTWQKGDPAQNGLSIDVLKMTVCDEDCYKAWFRDTMLSLIPMVVMMDFHAVVLHGVPFSDKERVTGYLEELAPGLLGALERTECRLIFDSDQQELVAAKGAAVSYLVKLFSFPDVTGGQDRGLEWSYVIDFSRNQI
jgi:Transcriptional regulator/sugar kinase